MTLIHTFQICVNMMFIKGLSWGRYYFSCLQMIFIHKSLNNIVTKLFADDANCFISDKDFNSLERLAEIELNKLQKMDKCKQIDNKFWS